MPISIFAKKVFRFKNPSVSLMKAASDGGKQPKFEEAFFETTPMMPQHAPDWVKDDPMWGWAIAEGSIEEFQPKAQMSASQSAMAAVAAHADVTAARGIEPFPIPGTGSVGDPPGRNDVHLPEVNEQTPATISARVPPVQPAGAGPKPLTDFSKNSPQSQHNPAPAAIEPKTGVVTL